jgi:hypothetical protein
MCAAVFYGLVGCQVWLDVEGPQCKSNKDCVGLFGRGFSCSAAGICNAPEAEPDVDAGMKPRVPARWACVNDAELDFIADPDRNVTVRMDAVDLNTLRVPQGLVGAACGPTDVDCTSPIVSDVRPAGDGFFEFNVPYGFEGFLTFNAPGTVPAMSFSNKPYLDSITTSGPALLTTKSLDDLATHSGHPIAENTGVAILEIRDCSDSAGDGVSFDNVGDEEPFYFDGALPARGLPATMVSNLLGAGREPRAVGGFSNLPPGYVTFHARLASNDLELTQVTIQVRAGQITYARVYAGY